MKAKMLGLVVVALAGCSTVPREIPKPAVPSIVFVRDTGFVGSGCDFAALVNGEVVGRLEAGQALVKAVPNGKHRVGIDNVTPICLNVKMNKVVDVSGAPVVLRLGYTSSGQIIFDQVE